MNEEPNIPSSAIPLITHIKQLKNFVDTTEASRITCLHPHTLRKYADEGKILCYKTPAGKRKFNREGLEKLCCPTLVSASVPISDKTNFIYARVSSRKQMDDLSRQLEYIKQRRPEYASYTVITDIASGINFKRKGIQTLLDSCIQGTFGELIVAHRDRLCRFGFELIKLFVEKSGGKITVLDDERNKSTEQELSEDLLSIIHIYSCKQMGKRSYRTKESSQSASSEIETIQ